MVKLHNEAIKQTRVVPDSGALKQFYKPCLRLIHMAELGDQVWSPDGAQVLGTPVGNETFVQRHVEERLAKEKQLWDAIPEVPDLQSSWQLLVQCAGPRANHLLRTLPPSQSRAYAEAHDDGMWAAGQALLGELPGSAEEVKMARDLATLPMRMGGLGLRSASRTAPAAYWASLADALPMIAQRLPAVAEMAINSLEQRQATESRPQGLAEAVAASELLAREGFLQRPGWHELRGGLRPQQCMSNEPGEWAHGWQYYASSTREHHFRRCTVLPSSSPADKAHLRTHSGRYAGAALAGAPTAPEFTIEPTEFRTLLLERLRLPLLVTEAHCEGCGRKLDELGRHRGACNCSGRLKRRAKPREVAMARICREAGATVKTHAKPRDMNIGVAASDERGIEVLAQDLPLWSGMQLAVDVTLRSAISAAGAARPRAAMEDGVVANGARRDKEVAYPELVASKRCRLVVAAIETGGRWSDEAALFIEDLACARARDAVFYLRAAAALAWQRRWARLMATSCAAAFARSLIAPAGCVAASSGDGPAPCLCDLLCREA